MWCASRRQCFGKCHPRYRRRSPILSVLLVAQGECGCDRGSRPGDLLRQPRGRGRGQCEPAGAHCQWLIGFTDCMIRFPFPVFFFIFYMFHCLNFRAFNLHPRCIAWICMGHEIVAF